MNHDHPPRPVRRWMSHFAVCAALGLSACGGGGGGASAGAGGGTGEAATGATLSGVVAGGPVAAATVSVYAAQGYVADAANTALATATSGSDGRYSVVLPVGTSGPLLLRAQAGSASTTTDEVLGRVALDSSYVLESVVPASMVPANGGSATVHLTPFTQAMATYVSRKFGDADLDAAIVAARSAVTSRLTSGADPLTTSPVSDATMVTLLASVSAIATGSHASAVSDPYNCVGKSSSVAKLACTVKTVSGALQPLAAGAAAGTAVVVNYNPVSALQLAASGLDAATVASNTSVSAASVASSKSTVSSALKSTATQSPDAAKGAASFFIRPRLIVESSRNGSLTILSGPDAGTYVGWSFAAKLCYGSDYNCVSVGPAVSYTPQDVLEDPELAQDVSGKVSRIIAAVNQLVGEALTANPSITNEQLESAIAAAIEAGVAADSIDAGLSSVRSALSTLGASGTIAATAATVDSPEAVAAAQACASNASYDNPDSVPYDPQLDSNCRLAQFDACLHREAGVTAYDQEGRTACQLVSNLINALTGTWSCKYCPYPY